MAREQHNFCAVELGSGANYHCYVRQPACFTDQ